MKKVLIYSVTGTPASKYASRVLSKNGIAIAASPGPDVTHLLLPVPSFASDGRIRGGGILENILGDLPPEVTVIGGNLQHPILHSYQTIDLLLDGLYTAQNAALTADCAIRIAAERMRLVWQSCPVLVIGWGRIGKCLAATLQALGATVSVAARKETDRNILRALGYNTEDPTRMLRSHCDYRVIFNTVPAMVVDTDKAANCAHSLKIELASIPGLAGDDVVSALGLPGKMVPESSGELIADTIIRLLKERKEIE
jgi:dipicolinate synthase subunit A